MLFLSKGALPSTLSQQSRIKSVPNPREDSSSKKVVQITTITRAPEDTYINTKGESFLETLTLHGYLFYQFELSLYQGH